MKGFLDGINLAKQLINLLCVAHGITRLAQLTALSVIMICLGSFMLTAHTHIYWLQATYATKHQKQVCRLTGDCFSIDHMMGQFGRRDTMDP